ncbi:MAG: Tol-Pal system beta propeller repeat protein TolB, partial [Pseudomonadota bacterium]
MADTKCDKLKKTLMRTVARVLPALILSACSGAKEVKIDHSDVTGSPVASEIGEYIPLAIAPFEWRGQGAAPINISSIVAADLRRSGLFSPTAVENLPEPSEPADDSMPVEYKKWRMRGIPYFVIGQLYKNISQPKNSHAYTIRFQLFDAYQGEMLIGFVLESHTEDLRRRTHEVSDLIYEALTRQRGAFATRIAFSSKKRDAKGDDQYAIEIADADAANPKSIVVSREPLYAPVWSPDGNDIAYVTMEKRHPQIYLQHLATGRRRLLADLNNLTSTPAWSPDGKKMALSLAQKTKPCIYLLEVQSKALQCVINRPGVIADPAWAPDGKSLLYTSGQSGSGQIHQYNVATGEDRQLTLSGLRNHHPIFAPDGLSIAFITDTADNRNQVMIMDLATQKIRTVDKMGNVKSLNFSPNGRMIIYATNIAQGGKQKSVLSVVSVDGHVKQFFSIAGADIGEPAWSPFGARLPTSAQTTSSPAYKAHYY